jgi:hypothetical protein
MCVSIFIAKDERSMVGGSGTCKSVIRVIYDSSFTRHIIKSTSKLSIPLFYLGATQYKCLQLPTDFSPCKKTTSWTHYTGNRLDSRDGLDTLVGRENPYISCRKMIFLNL